jgi:hypothetical protein
MAARRRVSSAIRNAGWVVGSCVSVLVLGEVILRLFLPIRPPATIGYPVAPSAALYGWGFNPGQLIVVSVAGNTAMAEDVFDYLIAQHERELSSYRKPQ